MNFVRNVWIFSLGLHLSCQAVIDVNSSQTKLSGLNEGFGCGSAGESCCQIEQYSKVIEFCFQDAPCVNHICQAPTCAESSEESLGYCEYAGKLLPCCQAELTCSPTTKTCQGTTACQPVGKSCLIHSECCLGSRCEDNRCVADDKSCVPQGGGCQAQLGGADCCEATTSAVSCVEQRCTACTLGGNVPGPQKPCCNGLSADGTTCASCRSLGTACQASSDCCSKMECIQLAGAAGKVCAQIAKVGNYCSLPRLACPEEAPLCIPELNGLSRCKSRSEAFPDVPSIGLSCNRDSECNQVNGEACCPIVDLDTSMSMPEGNAVPRSCQLRSSSNCQ